MAGNGGSVGLVVDGNKAPYLRVETRSPASRHFHNTITYIPWVENQSFFGEDVVYLESQGTFGEEEQGEYILGDKKVDRAAFEARQAEFTSLWTDLDLPKGPGNGGNNMSFSQIRSLDMNTYKFDSVD